MSDDLVVSVLPGLRQDRDPRLAQYVAALHQPDGWSLQQIGDALGTSREWVRVLEVRGYKQMAAGDRRDLTGLPTYSRRARKRMIAVASALPPETAEMLTTLNDEAQRWRHGKDKSNIIAFNKAVQLLLNAGVPMNAVARAVDQPVRSFRRRMNRWGVVGPNIPPPVPREVDRKSLTSTDGPRVPCKWPDCPSRLGTGDCIHQ